MWHQEGNASLTAQFKAGKTTLILNLVRALADGEPFLGCFDVTPPDGSVGLWDLELSPSMAQQWLRDARIAKPERVAYLNLRGRGLPLRSDLGAEWATGWLRQYEVETWVIDPWSRQYGVELVEENSNSEVGALLQRLATIKTEAGVRDLLLVSHTGRKEHEQGSEHVRGATVLDDWVDVRWLLTKDTDDDGGERFLHATGRDVDVPSSRLEWDRPADGCGTTSAASTDGWPRSSGSSTA